MSKSKRVRILDIDVDAITIEEAIEKIMIRCRQPGAVFIAKPYVEFFMQDQAKTLNRAWLSLPDGVALQWAAYYQRTNGSWWQLLKSLAYIVLAPSKLQYPLPDKFAGTNFTWPLLEAAAAQGRSIYLVGSPIEGSISQTAKTLEAEIANIDIVGTCPGKDDSGVFSSTLEKRLDADLDRYKPDLILIGIGFPRQELLMKRLIAKHQHGVFIGEGGTFDYQQFGGRRRKAPSLMQKVGLEWLWRLILEPSRIRRQMAIPRFIFKMYRFTNAEENKYHRNK